MTDSRVLGEVQGERLKGPDGREGHFILVDFLDLKTKKNFLLNLSQKQLLTFKDSVTLLLKLA